MEFSDNQVDQQRADYQSSFQDITQDQIGYLLRLLKKLVKPNYFDLSDSEIEGFLNVDIQEFRHWISLAEQRQPIQLSDDALCRICIMLDIYELIIAFFGNEGGIMAAVMSSPNSKLNELSAKQCIVNSADTSGLLEVWEYLIQVADYPGYVSMKERLKSARDNNQPPIGTSTALKLALCILVKWGSNSEQVGRILNIESAWIDSENLPETIALDDDQSLRVTFIQVIDDLLREVFSNPKNIDGFMGMINDNNPFNGVSPLMFIDSGEIENLKRAHDHIWGMAESL
jgi:hypothetical protein